MRAPALVDVARTAAPRVLGCAASDVALVQNVTTALASVVMSLPLPAGAVVQTFSFTYGATKKLAAHAAASRTGVRLRQHDVDLDALRARARRRTSSSSSYMYTTQVVIHV